MKSKCRLKWRKGEPVLGITLHFTDPSIFELTSMLGFNLIWIDMEHHAHSLETVSSLMRAVRTGNSEVLVRPANGEFMQAARLLEAGANGIMYPRCNTVAEAEELVKWTKFSPIGKRGLDASGIDAGYGSTPLIKYIEDANKETFLIVQIESKEGLINAEKIARVQGIDMLFFGPGDYSLENGFVGDLQDPRYWAAVEVIAQSAIVSGKLWGTPAFSSFHASQLVEKGAKLVTYSSDLTQIRKRFTEIKSEFQKVGFLN